MYKLLLLLIVSLLFYCENVPQYPLGQNDLIEMESVWQYLKAYSIYQDECVSGSGESCRKRLRDNPFLYKTPEEMMASMCDTLGNHNFTEYCSYCGSGAQAVSAAGLQKGLGGTSEDHRSVTYLQLTDSTALIKILDFETGFPYKQFAAFLPGLKGRNLIIDVCDNLGGDLDEIDSILELFLPESTAYLLVRSREYDPQAHQYHTVDFRPIKTKRPASPYLSGKSVVVLMNGQSASASEILAAGLKDGYGAVLAGRKSYGKAIGQIKIQRKGRKWLQITCMQMKSISAGVYQNVGLKPDIYLNDLDIYNKRQALLSVVKLVEPGVSLADLHYSTGLMKAAVATEPQGYIVRDVQIDPSDL